MKKAIRLYITGALQSLFFRQFIKEHAEKNNIKGFFHLREDGRAEVFLEGESDNVNKMIEICKQGPKHSIIRSVEEKQEHLQGFKEFKILTL
ncbi:MAG: acylphosphatase [Nanoarchaeota archaeon]